MWRLRASRCQQTGRRFGARRSLDTAPTCNSGIGFLPFHTQPRWKKGYCRSVWRRLQVLAGKVTIFPPDTGEDEVMKVLPAV